ncbi:MAG: TPM domain-containing protein [Blastomonas sp.]
MARSLTGLLCATLAAGPLHAQPAPAPSRPKVEAVVLEGQVLDEAQLLSAQGKQQLDTELTLLKQQLGPDFVVVTVVSLGNQPIDQFSLYLSTLWQIGDAQRQDGVLMLIAPNERQIRIDVGGGLKPLLTDPYCADVVRDTMLPLVRQGNMEGAIMAGAQQLIATMRNAATGGNNAG